MRTKKRIADLSGLLAEHFEPKPEPDPVDDHIDLDEVLEASPDGWWHLKYDKQGEQEWQPRPATDPEIAMRIFGALIKTGNFADIANRGNFKALSVADLSVAMAEALVEKLGLK